MLYRSGFAKISMEVSEVNSCWQIGVCIKSFCSLNVFSFYCVILINFQILPRLLERIIRVVLRRFLLLSHWLLWLSNLCFVIKWLGDRRLLLLLWLRSLRKFVDNWMFLKLVTCYEVDKVGLSEIASWSSCLHLAGQHSIIEEVEPSWGCDFQVLHFVVNLVCEWSRWCGTCKVERCSIG